VFTIPGRKLRRTAIAGVLGLLAGLATGCQESKRTEMEIRRKTEIEIGRNTLETREKMQTQRIEAAAARQRERLEAQKAREDGRRRDCWMEGQFRRCH
jgi:hypothetical protein